MKESQPLIIGVAGGTASGKTTFTRELVKRLAPNAALISHDSYYKPLDGLTVAQREQVNFDHPDSLDTELLIVQLQQLLAGNSIEGPIYDFSKHTRAKETEHLDPVHFIFVEGILVLSEPHLVKLFSLKIFVDASKKVRFERRLQRDTRERGRTEEYVRDQYKRTVEPMYDLFVEPTKNTADMVVNGEQDTQKEIETVITLLQQPKKLEQLLSARNSA